MYSISALDQGAIDLGRYWINPEGGYFPIEAGTPHPQWIASHPEILSNDKEKGWAERYKATPEHLIALLFADGWIRVSGDIIQLFNEHGMPTVAEFLQGHCHGDDLNKTISVVYSTTGKTISESVEEIISRYGHDSSGFQLVASQKILKPYSGIIKNRGWIAPNGETYPFGEIDDMQIGLRDAVRSISEDDVREHKDWIRKYYPWLLRYGCRFIDKKPLQDVLVQDLTEQDWIAVMTEKNVFLRDHNSRHNLLGVINHKKFIPSFPFVIMDMYDRIDTYHSLGKLEEEIERDMR
jgi:hypothetical protein